MLRTVWVTLFLAIGFLGSYHFTLWLSSEEAATQRAARQKAISLTRDVISLARSMTTAILSQNVLIRDHSEQGTLKLAPGVPTSTSGIEFISMSSSNKAKLVYQFCDPRFYSATTKLREPAPEDLELCQQKNAAITTTIIFEKLVENHSVSILATGDVSLPIYVGKKEPVYHFSKPLEFTLPIQEWL